MAGWRGIAATIVVVVAATVLYGQMRSTKVGCGRRESFQAK